MWLHKGAFGCAEDIVKGKKTTKYVHSTELGDVELTWQIRRLCNVQSQVIETSWD